MYSKLLHNPIPKCVTLTGEKHIVTNFDNTRPTKHKVGKEYQIIYNPTDKREFKVYIAFRCTVSLLLILLGIIKVRDLIEQPTIVFRDLRALFLPHYHFSTQQGYCHS